MGVLDSDLDFVVGDTHELLEPPAPAYSDLTVRRAFIVWMHLGQTNKFRDVCNYYHRLEALEETLTEEQRAASRHSDMELFVNQPRLSLFGISLFPDLYPRRSVEPQFIEKVEGIRNDRCVFKLEGFNKYQRTGSSRDLHEVSKLIRQHCLAHNITLRRFGNEFKNYTSKCRIQESVANVADYVKRKSVGAELITVQDYTNNYNFLDLSNSSDGPEVKKRRIPPVSTFENEAETKQLRLMLALGSSSSNGSTSAESQSSSCAEFFKLFNNKKESRKTSKSVQAMFENYAAIYKQHQMKRKAMECDKIWMNASSFLEQKYAMGSMNKAQVKTYRQ
ncbi:hypothetical protein ACJJTC_015446 [Scirpophaga incertulas]